MWLGSFIIGRGGAKVFKWIAISHIGSLRKADFSYDEKPRCIAASLVIPALLIRSKAPIHNERSGFTGFLTITGTSTPFKASAISCTVNGFTVERAPTHNISTPAFKA